MGLYPTGSFHHPLLKQLIYTNILLINTVYGTFIFFLVYEGLKDHFIFMGITLMAVGVFVWTLAEYVVHRFILHGHFVNAKFQYFMHGYHHAYPKDVSRYALPMILTFPSLLVVYFLTQLIFASYSNFLISGFILGYLVYDTIHYVVHRFNPKNPIGKFLKIYHFYHHFKNSERCFGVSNPFWDCVFRTTKLNR